VSCGMIYFGFFSGAITKKDGRLHAFLGNVYTWTLGLCYVTSWGRHKNKYITLAAEFVHGSLGYATIGLASELTTG